MPTKSLDTTYLKRVRRLFNSDMVSRETNRHNQRAWVRSVRALGPNWLLAAPINAPKTPTLYSEDLPPDVPMELEAELAEFRKALAELMYNDPAVPKAVKTEFAEFQRIADEFPDFREV